MTLTIEVYEADSTTLVDTIDAGQWRFAGFGDVGSSHGKFDLLLPNVLAAGATNPALALIETGRLVRFFVDGVARFQGVIEDQNITLVAPEAEAGEVTAVTGRGTLAVLDKVRVRPDRGVENEPWHPTRWFNFSADRLRDDDIDGPQGVWPAAYGQLPNYDTDNYFGRPEGFVDTAGPDGDGPEWLWEDDTRTAMADAGVVYFRQRFTLATAGAIEFQFAADDEGELWVDGVLICRSEGVYLGGCVKATVRLTAGEHLVAALGRNLNALRAGVVFAGWTVTDGMPDTLVVRSDSAAAICLPYPADPPGFTPTEVIRLVVDEVQDLAVPRLADVTFSFISASDTDLAAVDEVTDITCHAPGDSILTLIEMLGETYLDVSMSPDSLELNAWIRGTRGSDLSATVVFEKGNCRRVTEDSVGSERATVALVSGSGFAPFENVHFEALSNGIYEEVALDFGDASYDAAWVFSDAYLNLVWAARNGVTVELVPAVGPVPYEDFDIGDTVSVLGQDRRVAAIGLAVGPDSITRWTVDFDQPRMLLEERLGAIMRRQLPGTAGGRTLLPSPQAPQFVANQSGSEDVHTWQWDGPLGEIQVYKNTTAITGALVDASDLTTAGDTAKTTITDAARKFVKDSDKIQISVGGGALSPSWVPPKGRWLQEVRATVSDDGETMVITVMVA